MLLTARAWRITSMWTACIVVASCANTQPKSRLHITAPVSARDTVTTRLLASWRRVAVDSVALRDLVDETTRHGESGMRALLRVVVDSTLNGDVRLYALRGLEAYYGRWGGCGQRVCTYSPSDPPEAKPAILRMVSISPELRDTMRKTLLAVAEERGRVGATVAEHIGVYARVERWHAGTRRICAIYWEARRAAHEMHSGSIPIASEEMETLTRCTESAPPVLAEMWSMVGEDSASLTLLVAATVTMRDARLHDALLATASDRRRPEGVRVAATLAFGTQIHEGAVRLAQTRNSNSGVSRSGCSLEGQYSQRAQEAGSHPLSPATIEGGQRALGELARAVDLEAVRSAANDVLRCLAELQRR